MRELNSVEITNVVGGLALFTWKDCILVGSLFMDFARGFRKGVKEQYRQAVTE